MRRWATGGIAWKLALLALGAFCARVAMAKCEDLPSVWSLTLVSVTCERDGAPCAADTAAAEEWLPEGTLEVYPDDQGWSIQAFADGRIGGPAR
jgi:hypothetical protein